MDASPILLVATWEKKERKTIKERKKAGYKTCKIMLRQASQIFLFPPKTLFLKPSEFLVFQSVNLCGTVI